MNQHIALYLLESPQSHPLQYWAFEQGHLVRIGRSWDNDVVLSTPYVSRAHAYIHFDSGDWYVTSISEQGVLCSSRKFRTLKLLDGVIFRLGQAGPHLRFSNADAGALDATTLSHEVPGASSMHLDEGQLMREVGEIVGDPYFQRLKAELARLRRGPHEAATAEYPVEPPPGPPRGGRGPA
ncbi:FHA domain protein [Aquisphaera giovannonii]|uniref:FHA domain protein n=1 Tax=Aquisphaera giovannonii TaxID=406548 RepID=A0A5B9VUE0_9BACT|nr:FHA domain-containing protein [Aquisphaera giovannonii]QEH32003.1 FHA domain protein [Aquisphaera giovannonii]